MSEVTADTITDTQIRELMDDPVQNVRVNARLALGESSTFKSASIITAARARCAEIINKRKKES